MWVQLHRPVRHSVTITTSKSPRSLGLHEDVARRVFVGTAREACRRFPRNVNVHAAVAIAGIGFDRTVSPIEAVTGQTDNEHRIAVRGRDLSWTIEASSRSLGGVTVAYTPASVRRMLNATGIVFA